LVQRYFSRKQLTAELRRRGYPIGDSTLAKLCSPSIGKGPPLAALDGRRQLYRLSPALRWAEARLRRSEVPGMPHQTSTTTATDNRSLPCL